MHAAVAWSLAVAFGLFVLALGDGLGAALPVAGTIAALATAALGLHFRRRPPVALDPGACPRALRVVASLATAAALVQLGRLTVFAILPDAGAWSWAPGSEWERRHSCLTAYHVAAGAAAEGRDIYDHALYSAPDDDPARPRKALRLGPFTVDVFEYPPPFLLLPRAIHLLVPEFEDLRSFWFGLNGALVLAAMLAVARGLGPAVGTRALLLTPLVLAALPTASALQKGNVQLLVVAGSMVAMALLERGRHAAGGALLAFATASKLFPGLLGIWLLARRQWRAAAWTTAFGIAFVLLTLADLGWVPFAAFVDHVPGLLSGEAFPAFRNPRPVAANFSIPGMVFKPGLFGVDAGGFAAARIVGWVYTVIATVVVWRAGRRGAAADRLPLVWLAILILATLRSPFLPPAYAGFPPLWLLALWGARRATSGARLVPVLLLGAALNVYWPNDWGADPRLMALVVLLPQTVTVLLALLALRDAREPALVLERPSPRPLAAAPEGARTAET